MVYKCSNNVISDSYGWYYNPPKCKSFIFELCWYHVDRIFDSHYPVFAFLLNIVILVLYILHIFVLWYLRLNEFTFLSDYVVTYQYKLHVRSYGECLDRLRNLLCLCLRDKMVILLSNLLFS